MDEANQVVHHVRSLSCLPITVDGTYFGIEVLADSKSERVEWNSGLPAPDALWLVLTELA